MPSFVAPPRWKRIGASLAMWMLTRSAQSEPQERALVGPLDRSTLIELAVARSPSVRAMSQYARGVSISSKAEGKQSPPEAMVSAWQVPLARPYAVNDAAMVMVGLQQKFAAPGSLGAREEGKQEEAHFEEAMVSVRARQIARDADHAFADYEEATLRHRVHLAHLDIAKRIHAVAQARHAGGGLLSEATQAEVLVAQTLAEVVTDGARIQVARVRINALVARHPNAPLGPPVESEPAVPAWSLETMLAKSQQARPELRAANASRAAKALELRALDREATWPSFAIAGLYFAPTGPSPTHGYGLNASMSLPWLWGPGALRRDAQREYVVSAATNVDAMRIQIQADVATSDANAKSAALRVQVLRDRASPASKRSFDVAWAGYETARGDLVTLLNARKAVIDIEMDTVMARSVLQHALADLDAAVGTPVPRTPLGPFQEPDGVHNVR